MWGRFSDRVGRRPALLIALSASAIAYLIFGFADSLLLLFLSRVVQGAGGGTVGVIQAYVADSTAPQDRARALAAAMNPARTFGPAVDWNKPGEMLVTGTAKAPRAGKLDIYRMKAPAASGKPGCV